MWCVWAQVPRTASPQHTASLQNSSPFLSGIPLWDTQLQRRNWKVLIDPNGKSSTQSRASVMFLVGLNLSVKEQANITTPASSPWIPERNSQHREQQCVIAMAWAQHTWAGSRFSWPWSVQPRFNLPGYCPGIRLSAAQPLMAACVLLLTQCLLFPGNGFCIFTGVTNYWIQKGFQSAGHNKEKNIRLV